MLNNSKVPETDEPDEGFLPDFSQLLQAGLVEVAILVDFLLQGLRLFLFRPDIVFSQLLRIFITQYRSKPRLRRLQFLML